MRKIILCAAFFLILLTSTTISWAQETHLDYTEFGPGILIVPSGIEVINTSKGSYNLLSNDNGIWRTVEIIMIPLRNVDRRNPSEQIDDFNYRSDQQLKVKIDKPGVKLLENTPFMKHKINNLEIPTKATIIFEDGTISRSNCYILKGNNTGALVVFAAITPDAEYEYWKPIIYKMIESIKR